MKAKIESVEFVKEYESKYGVLYSFKIGYNGITAYYSSKNKEQNKFIKGQEAEFDEETKTSQNGEYKTIKPIYTQPSGGGFQKKPVQYASFAVSYAKDLIIGGKVELKDLEKETERIFNLMKKLDGQ